MGTINRYLGVFVFIFAVILILSAAGPALSTSSPQGASKAQVPDSFAAENVVAQPAPETGNVTLEAGTDSKVVVIDASHGNSYSRSEIQPLIDALVENGHQVRFYGSSGQSQGFQTTTLNDTLVGADAFVTVAPSSRFSDSEVRGLADFETRGGRVLLLAEPDSTEIGLGGPFGFSVDQVTSELTAPASRFDMTVDTGYLFNMFDRQNNFRNVYAEPATGGNLTEGVDRVMLSQATSVRVGENATVAFRATERTQLSTTRDRGQYAVAARSGNVTLVGDSSFLAPSNYQDEDNEVLIGNVAEFLVTGNKTAAPQEESVDDGFGPGPGPEPITPSPDN